MDVPKEDRKDLLIIRELMAKCEITPNYVNAWAYKENQKIYDFIECRETGRKHTLKGAKQSRGGMTAAKRGQFQTFWIEMEKDLSMNVQRCASIVDLPYDDAKCMMSTSVGRLMVKQIIQRRKEAIKGTEHALIAGAREIAFSNPSDILDLKGITKEDQEQGWFRMKDINEIPDYVWRCVQQFEYDKNGNPKVKFQPKAPFYNLLFKHFGLLDDNSSVDDPHEIAVQLRKFADSLGDAIPGGI
ncbi:MAG: hypothetical protein GY751_10760 [Bacteroidetes bacterium]|nr:hypothetical protein [Bacteroidota bacterium]